MSSSNDTIKSLTDKHTLNVYPHTLEITLESGDGCYLRDVNGKSYLDFASGLGVNVLGYNHPSLQQALLAQLEKLTHGSNMFYYEGQACLAEKLCALSSLDKVFFSCSGTEAVETAIKLARRWGNRLSPGKNELICFKQGWHGRTISALSLSGDSELQNGFEPLLPGIKVVECFDLDQLSQAISDNTAAVIIEPVLGHAGVTVCPKGFLAQLREVCTRRDILLILDEIQTGIGRTGKFLYCQHEDVVPDILLLGKGLAGGMPLGACLAKSEVAEVMTPGSHGSTFGGNPLACCAALEVVSLVSEHSFLDTVRHKSKILQEGLLSLQASHASLITDTSSVGLMAAYHLNCNRLELQKDLAHAGLIVTSISPNYLRFLPALVISEEQIQEGLNILGDILCKT